MRSHLIPHIADTRRMVAATVLPVVLVAACDTATRTAVGSACPDGVAPSTPTAELFATTNTAIITDPADARLRDTLSGMTNDVDATVVRDGGVPIDSTLTNGVFWSDETHQTTFEPSRVFRLACTDDAELRHIAAEVREKFHQESVLTFTFIEHDRPEKSAVMVDVPGGEVERLRDALVADPDMQKLVGGSVTQDHHLIMVAELSDLKLVEELVDRIDAQWSGATVRYGKREFVGSDG